MTNSRSVFITLLRVRWTSRLRQETQYLASILTDKLVQCIFRNTRKTELALEVSTFTEFTLGHGDDRWPTEVTSNTCFRAAVSSQYRTWTRWNEVRKVEHLSHRFWKPDCLSAYLLTQPVDFNEKEMPSPMELKHKIILKVVQLLFLPVSFTETTQFL